ncbi:MAG TPA: RNA polymerase subunit sigma-70 [Gaiella sp.]|nr:RNA polymerase subunit sigma-70 [Gaiella sp.]
MTTEIANDALLLAAARRRDEQAFVRLTAPHRRGLHRHCYRMLGSLDDADDALQEAMLRAWRGLPRFEPSAPLRSWLYRIATNVCLTAAERRARDRAGIDRFLQPYPDVLLEEIPARDAGPEVIAEEREAIGLALVAAMQTLPPKQRAVLVLREALGWSAREVADALDDTVPAVNSALQRAREGLERERADGGLVRAHASPGGAVEAHVMRRFVEAWEAVDVRSLVSLLSGDAVMTMPPEPMRLVGPDAIGSFFAAVPARGDLARIRLVPTAANRQPAFAAYFAAEPGAAHVAYGVMVFAFAGESIVGITGFAGYPQLFPALGLPDELPS